MHAQANLCKNAAIPYAVYAPFKQISIRFCLFERMTHFS